MPVTGAGPARSPASCRELGFNVLAADCPPDPPPGTPQFPLKRASSLAHLLSNILPTPHRRSVISHAAPYSDFPAPELREVTRESHCQPDALEDA